MRRALTMRHNPVMGLLLTVGLILGLGSPPLADAAPKDRWTNGDQFFRIEAQPIQKRGRTVLAGYVYNRHYQNAKVRLEIEGLDAQGNVIGTQPGFVDDIVPLANRVYFEVPVRIAGAVSYKTYILWYDWVGESRGGDFVLNLK
jgi:hypothetical protein